MLNEPPPPANPVPRAVFLEFMRGVASSVAVVTTNGDAGKHGTTVSSFCSVSADPPTMLVCVDAQSRIAQMIRANGVFNINVLPQDGIEIAKRFAGADDGWLNDRFDGIKCSDAKVPEIIGASVLSCVLVQSVLAGSHQICIGQVGGLAKGAAAPLTYFDGSYHQIMKTS